jgi:D-alanyl-D-alanine endopeptidase (penicillin-binding protein 7)
MRLTAWLLTLSLCLPAVVEARRPVRRAAVTAKAGKKSRRRHGVSRSVPTYTRGGLPNIQAHAAMVVDFANDTVVYEKNPDEQRPIASISKLMAMMVVLDRKLDLDQTTAIIEDDRRLALRGARSRLPVGVSFSHRDLLHAVLMASDNRGVPALGRAVGLSPDQLTAEMNRKAQALGLGHTSFGDPTGLDDRNRSTPREVVKMLRAALKYPLIAEITRKATYVAHAIGPKRRWTVEYNNTDVYTRTGSYHVLGGKTGYTDLAGYCLAIAARIDGRGDLGMAFLGADGKMTRFADFARTAQWIAEKKPSVTAVATRPPAAPSAPAASAAPVPAGATSAAGAAH